MVMAVDRAADLTTGEIAWSRVGRRHTIIGVHIDIGVPSFNRRNQFRDGGDPGGSLVDQIG